MGQHIVIKNEIDVCILVWKIFKAYIEVLLADLHLTLC